MTTAATAPIPQAKTATFLKSAEALLADLGVTKPKVTDTEAVAALLALRWEYLRRAIDPPKGIETVPFTPDDGPFVGRYQAQNERLRRGWEAQRIATTGTRGDGWVSASDWNRYGVVSNRAHIEGAIGRLVKAGVMEHRRVTWEIPAVALPWTETIPARYGREAYTESGTFEHGATTGAEDFHRLRVETRDLDDLLASFAADRADDLRREADNEGRQAEASEREARVASSDLGKRAATAPMAEIALAAREVERQAEAAFKSVQRCDRYAQDAAGMARFAVTIRERLATGAAA